VQKITILKAVPETAFFNDEIPYAFERVAADLLLGRIRFLNHLFHNGSFKFS